MDTEIHLLIQDRVADRVQESGGEAKTGEIVSLTELHNLEYYLRKIYGSAYDVK